MLTRNEQRMVDLSIEIGKHPQPINTDGECPECGAVLEPGPDQDELDVVIEHYVSYHDLPE